MKGARKTQNMMLSPAVNLHPANGLNNSSSTGGNHSNHNKNNGISISISNNNYNHKNNRLLKVCAWCENPDPKLPYLLTHEKIRKAFCSESCMNEFRESYSKVRILILSLTLSTY